MDKPNSRASASSDTLTSFVPLFAILCRRFAEFCLLVCLYFLGNLTKFDQRSATWSTRASDLSGENWCGYH